MTGAALALLLLCLPTHAQFEDSEDVSYEEEPAPMSEQELREKMARRLRSDPAAVVALAERINRSKVSAGITRANDEQTRMVEISDWILKNSDQAAWLGLGLAQDDKEGSKKFETLISRDTKLVLNPNSDKGIYGNLSKSSKKSRLMKKAADEEMSSEEQREILKTMFEGQGNQSNRIITQEEQFDPDKAKAAGAPGATGANFSQSLYDRLSASNLRGYSPQMAALQSALNRRRVPGAPKLIETGKLDYETLSYPSYSMKWDLGNLEKRLRYERAYALARLLGKTLTQNELLDPAVEAKLKSEAAAKGGRISPRFDRRTRALERAAAAIDGFDETALAAKDPAQISRALLVSLGAGEKEAARWITVASLEDELQRLDLEENFLSAELLAMIDQASVDDGTKQAYKNRGQELLKSVKALKANDERAIALLESEQWLANLGAVEATLNQNSSLRHNLSRNIATYANTAFRFAQLADRRAGWRRMLDEYLKRFLSSNSYVRALKRAEAERAVLKDVFMKIAMGNMDAAHTILASTEPSGGPPKKR